MKTRLVDSGWSREFANAARGNTKHLRIVCPFIKVSALERLLSSRPKAVQVITRFNLADFAEGVSDIESLRRLLALGAMVRGIKNLHSKLYLFGTTRVLITSANLTDRALTRNHEFGMVSTDAEVIATCRAYFDRLWQFGKVDLTAAQVENWDTHVTKYLAEGGKPNKVSGLGDFGADAGMNAEPILVPTSVSDAKQAFVKFLGEGHNRVALSFTTLEEIERSGCHWAVAYPAARRPRAVRDDAVMYIGRLTEGPNDIRVFGRAIGMRYVAGRDDATQEDIERRDWKVDWPRYIRVHHAEFVAGTMENGVSLNQLMEALGARSFASTKRNRVHGKGNTDPRKAYRQQAAVELSSEGMSWLGDRLQEAFEEHGTVPTDALEELDWPTVP